MTEGSGRPAAPRVLRAGAAVLVLAGLAAGCGRTPRCCAGGTDYYQSVTYSLIALPAGIDQDNELLATLAAPGRKPRTYARALSSPAVIARLAALLNDLHTSPPESISCPIMLPSFQVALATRPGRAPVALVSPDGCSGEVVTVRRQVRTALEDIGSTRMLRAVERLFGAHHVFW